MTADLNWRKSSYSVANSACVEVAIIGSEPDPSPAIAVRDSKNPSGAVLFFQSESWRWFIDDVRSGRIRAT